MKTYYPSDNQCITHNEKKIFYNDNNHLSRSGIEILVDFIKKYIQ